MLGHLTKVVYFGILVANPAGHDLEQWLVMAFGGAVAVLGTHLSRRLLDKMSDKQFYWWTRRVIPRPMRSSARTSATFTWSASSGHAGYPHE